MCMLLYIEEQKEFIIYLQFSGMLDHKLCRPILWVPYKAFAFFSDISP